MKQINVGVIGTGWTGGIRANACATNVPLGVGMRVIQETGAGHLALTRLLKRSLQHSDTR